ncbi:SafA/ExsA family spore coat assembly protein [Oceanobacillus damuensis]|uniref:SafA/ExsA family spore coat assembly protein n=1 Tax=Oceanobacillus damuensis TaxID=937928 RepID=UPI00083764B4|nr:SafA/ExsA family spore coat assembly protein [Oceanobacillus damuensis]
MKIHIVQKGDTLWEISKKYGVDFEELKGINSQLSSPDMIMPGMKIKIPGTSKQVQKENVALKETKKETVQQPYKDFSPKPIAAIQEDDAKVQKPVKPKMPIPSLPQMPVYEQDIKQYTTINFPQMPQMKAPQVKPEKEKVKKEEVKQQQPIMKPIQKPQQQPVKLPQSTMKPAQQPIQPTQQPVQPTQQAPVYQPIHHQPMQHPCPPVIPVCWHHFHHPYCPPMPYHHTPIPYGEQMNPNFTMPAQDFNVADCGCNGGQTMAYGQMDPGLYPMADGYSVQQQPFGGMYPPQFGSMQDDGSLYPQPPAFPGFSALRKEENDQEMDEEKENDE